MFNLFRSKKENLPHKANLITGFKIGDNVSHPKFGYGVVTAYEKPGRDEIVHVRFDSEGLKVLALEYANLKLVAAAPEHRVAQSEIGKLLDVDPAPAVADDPVGFGYKTNWFAIRTEDSQAVIKALSLTDANLASWKEGIRSSYQSSSQSTAPAIFVTPVLNGWVLVTGKSLPYPDSYETQERGDIRRKFDHLFARLADKFQEVQFFGTYRVVGFNAWGRARNGQVERLFSFVEDVTANVGTQTSEERLLGFVDLGNRTAIDATKYIHERADQQSEFIDQEVKSGKSRKDALTIMRRQERSAIPDETDTTALAGIWSIDPTKLEDMQLPPSLGYVGTLPAEYSY